MRFRWLVVSFLVPLGTTGCFGWQRPGPPHYIDSGGAHRPGLEAGQPASGRAGLRFVVPK